MPSDRAPHGRAGRSSVVVPTLNAEVHLRRLLPVLHATRPRPREVVFIDSGSTDRTAELVQAAGFTLVRIPPEQFGHGRTRNLALRLCEESDYVAFLTQDALPNDPAWLHDLLGTLTGPVAVAFGRQLPRPGASAAERFSRSFNYPAAPCTTTLADMERMGVRAVFCSNSFAAYDRRRLLSVGGFPEDLPMGEDMAATLRLLRAGFARAYAAGVTAIHSHDYTLAEEFRRYFDIGVLLHHDPELRSARVATSGRGASALRAELRDAWRRGGPGAAGAVLNRAAAKLAGFQLGRHHRAVPRALCRRCSMHKQYWAAA